MGRHQVWGVFFWLEANVSLKVEGIIQDSELELLKIIEKIEEKCNF